MISFIGFFEGMFQHFDKQLQRDVKHVECLVQLQHRSSCNGNDCRGLDVGFLTSGDPTRCRLGSRIADGLGGRAPLLPADAGARQSFLPVPAWLSTRPSGNFLK